MAYFTESRELLSSMELSLLALEKNSFDKDSINSIFRAAHTIKGNSGMFGFERVGDFTHFIENILVGVRNETISVVPSLTTLLLECHDFIQTLMDHYEDDEENQLDEKTESLFNELIERLNGFIPASNGVIKII
jgi:Chemotaxis protein histidine kinase and related kinases